MVTYLLLRGSEHEGLVKSAKESLGFITVVAILTSVQVVKDTEIDLPSTRGYWRESLAILKTFTLLLKKNSSSCHLLSVLALSFALCVCVVAHRQR